VLKQTRKKIKRSLNWIILPLLWLAVTACSSGAETAEPLLQDELQFLGQEVSASGEVVPVQWITLSYPGGASELDIKVAAGDFVSQNDLLVSTNDGRLLANLFQAQAVHERAQLAYELAVNAPSAAELAAAKSALANAEANLQRQEDLGANDTVIDAAHADVDAAQAALDLIQDGTPAEEIAAADFDLRAAERNLQTAQQAFDLKAPFSGTVVEILVQPGETVSAFQPVLVLADLTRLQVVTTDLSEIDVSQLREGQTAQIVFDAIADQSFTGTIEHIADQATGVSAVYYEVTLALDEIPEGLRWGMTAFITFPLN
jgi:multidrug efflux pump subunit AcrA (membrane-fusion protein)